MVRTACAEKVEMGTEGRTDELEEVAPKNVGLEKCRLGGIGKSWSTKLIPGEADTRASKSALGGRINTVRGRSWLAQLDTRCT